MTANDTVSPRTRLQSARGFTILELLMATGLTLMLMLVVVNIFGAMSRTVSHSRATLEITDRLRAARAVLQADLEGLTVPVVPPRRPEAGEGYLEIAEGVVGPVLMPNIVAVDVESVPVQADTTVADFDDVLMFTTRTRKAPFIGRYPDPNHPQIECEDAEIAWFVRGRTLYRRVLVVAPQTMRPEDGDWLRIRCLDNNYDSNMATNPIDDPTDENGVIDIFDLGGAGFYEVCDLSARPEWDKTGSIPGWVPNTLGDLTKRECRFAHAVRPEEVFPPSTNGYPYPISDWGQLGLPLLRECSHKGWMGWPNRASMPGVTPVAQIDLWNNPHPWADTTTTPPTPQVDRNTGTLLGFQGPRIAEDVILTNVIGFDVKVWDPGAPVLRAVNDNDTPLNLGDDSLVLYDYDADGTPETPVLVVQGDPGYPLALAHLMQEWANPPGSRNPSFLPPGSDQFGNGALKGMYVDLGYPEYTITTYGVPWSYGSTFSGIGGAGLNRVYDTWSFHYEHDGVDQDGDGTADEGTNGFDDNGDGVVDDLLEREAPPPYAAPLRGIQVKIRTFEPDSRQVREVTVVVNFTRK